MAKLTKAQLTEALGRLGRHALADGEAIDLVVVGGAAMVLAFESRETTKDVDAVIRAPAPTRVRELVVRVAAELEWPEDWLNDAAKGYVGVPSEGPVLLEAPGIVVRMVSVEQLLALKLSAWRDDVDIDDSRLLLARCTGQRDAVWARVEPFLPKGREQTAWYAFQDLWDEAHGED